jgi:hypothetical protein
MTYSVTEGREKTRSLKERKKKKKRGEGGQEIKKSGSWRVVYVYKEIQDSRQLYYWRE